MVVNVIGWIVLGLIGGCIASKLVDRRGERLKRDISLGIVGAVTSGWGYAAVGVPEVTGFNAWSLMVAGVGAAALLVAWRLVMGMIRGAWGGVDAMRGSAVPVQGSRNRKERM